MEQQVTSEGRRGRGRPRADNKRRGYSVQAHNKHPGVTIAQESRVNGELVLVIRWKDPGTKKWKKADLRDAAGERVVSRNDAERYAENKSKEIQDELKRIASGGRPTDTTITWEKLIELHTEQLNTRNRSQKTVRDYQQTWRFLNMWPGRPLYPHKLTEADLEGFLRYLRSYRGKKTKALSPHSIAAVVNHLKVLLNYGRRHLSCIKLDSEVIGTALNPGKLPQTMPVALDTKELCAVLKAAKKHDKKEPDQAVFPFLAFLMITGCRRGEAERLRFSRSGNDEKESWIDFEGNRIVLWGKKTSRHRVISLSIRPRLRDLLLELRDSRDTAAEPYVFGGPLPLAIGDKREKTEDGKTGKSLKLALYEVRKKSKIKYKLKDLRSTNATYLANSDLGSNLYSLAGELGHDYAVLIKHYANHRQLAEKQRKASTVEGVLGVSI